MILKIANSSSINNTNPVSRKNASFGQTRASALSPLDKDRFEICSKNLLSLGAEEITKRINDSLNKECFLGKGCEANVYKIKGSDYVVRIPYEVFSDILKPSKLNLKVTEQDKINHVVARFDNGVTIMNFIKGYSLYGDIHVTNEKQNKIDNMLLDLPVSAYHNLFKQVCHARDNDMIFDCDGRNVILDPEKKTLTAIDFNPMDPDYPEAVKPLRHIYAAVATTAKGSEGKLAGMILKGALKEFAVGVKPCMDIGEIRFFDFIAVVKADVSKPIFADWQDLKETLTDVEVLKFKELIGEKVNEELSEKLKMADEMINRVLMK